MAAAADYCLATEAAAIKLSELAIGIGPFVISPAVTRKIGLPAFSQLTIRASDFQTAQWVKEKGLYNEVYATTADMDEALRAYVEVLDRYTLADVSANRGAEMAWPMDTSRRSISSSLSATG